MEEDLQGADVTAQLSGVPVMQIDIRQALERDRIVYNALGLLAGCVIAILFFRRVSFMIIAAAPPLIAIVLSLGALGWLGFRLNMFLNVMTPLIMVISFSDSMQLTFAARDRMIAGADRETAFRDALRVVGPACVLTHAAAGLSLLGLLFSSSDLIRAFGAGGLPVDPDRSGGGVGAGPAARHPARAAAEARSARSSAARDVGVRALRRFCGFVAERMLRRPGLNAGSACSWWSRSALSMPACSLAIASPTRRRTRSTWSRPARASTLKLNGANPIDLFIAFPAGSGLFAPETLDVIAEAHRDHGAAAGDRQCVVARDSAPLAHREARQARRRDAEAICRFPAAFPGAALHRAGPRCRR